MVVLLEEAWMSVQPWPGWAAAGEHAEVDSLAVVVVELVPAEDHAAGVAGVTVA